MNPHRFNRRRFLAASTLLTAAVYSNPWSLAAAESVVAGRRLDLNGAWQFSRAGTDDWLPATVPGCIHTDLLAAAKIPDPYFRDNEKLVQWVSDEHWIYRRRFEVPAEILRSDCVRLRCEGLDTLAILMLNGQELGRTDNMFRTWEFDVKPMLQAGVNVLDIAFAPPLPYIQERQSKRVLYEWSGPHEPRGRAWVRKEPCNFGWDWAPVLITCGIWRNIELMAFDQARLEDVAILQEHSVAGGVSLQIDVDIEMARAVAQAAPLKVIVVASHGGEILQTANVTPASGSARVVLALDHPKLWWPAGMGEQPLYEVSVELRGDGGDVLDRTVRRIGLRTLKLLPPDAKNSLRFEVNGVPFFAKGANLVPADAFASRVRPEVLRRLAAEAVAVNMNALRFWGGGYYEDDALFSACDELGICVWLDFKFACSSYPVFDPAFLENVRQEARDQLRRLRHHPCIAVWCGNNEIGLMTKPEWSDASMGQADYDTLFKELLGRQVRELAPQANYVSGSPDCGDVHYWKVWHGGRPFEDFRTLTGFMSEFGFQSFPVPKTVRTWTYAEDRAAITTPVMDWHERSGTTGIQKIRDMIPHYFNPPKDFESALWLSQIVQGLGIKLGAEHWRRTMPKSMGCMFWQYNDCWPVASWSSVDYFGRWKALQFLARRFYAPLLVSGLENADRGTVEIHVTSDRLEACHGTVEWNVTDAAGNTLAKNFTEIEILPRQSRRVKTLRLRKEIKARGLNNVLVWLSLTVNGQVVSDNLVWLVPPKVLRLTDPQINTSVARAEDGFLVTVTAASPALWCWLDLPDTDAKYSDNFIHLRADRPAQIRVTPNEAMDETIFWSALRVRSLFDTGLPAAAIRRLPTLVGDDVRSL